MAGSAAASNKAKIARRVVEVLEYFDHGHPQATVMDIVRRYDRPQSSTSELLSSLVELGLLRKDAASRAYSLTARAALLGCAVQSKIIRDGRLVRLVDRLAAQTGLTVALFARVGLLAQVVSVQGGARGGGELFGGMQVPLNQSAVGWLLLSTIARQRRDGMLRRLNAEATDHARFALPELAARIEDCAARQLCDGALGFGANARIVAALLPDQPSDEPLVLGLIYTERDKVLPENLRRCLLDAIGQAHAPAMGSGANVEPLSTAA